jgi:hypothetical protein
MSAIDQSGRWYYEPLQETASEHLNKKNHYTGDFLYLEVLDDLIQFRATPGIPIDHLIQGELSIEGCNQWNPALPEDITEALRERLGLNFSYNTGLAALGDIYYSDGRVGIWFEREELSDAEAMFLLALPLATAERPLEIVLEQIRQCAELGMNHTVLAFDHSDFPTLEAQTASEKDFSKAFTEVMLADEWDNKHDVLDAMRTRPSVVTFVESFGRYKQLIESVAMTRGDERTRIIKEIVALERKLTEQQGLANTSLQFGKSKHSLGLDDDYVDLFRYEVSMGLFNFDQKTHKEFLYTPVDTLCGDITPADKEKLHLFILPKGYTVRHDKTRALALKTR